MAIRNIKKNLAGMQDILQGYGTETQARGLGTYTIDKVDLPFAVASVAAMQALDVTVYTRARVYHTELLYTDYIHHSTDSTGVLPDVGAGSWHVASAAPVAAALTGATPAVFGSNSIVLTQTGATNVTAITGITDKTYVDVFFGDGNSTLKETGTFALSGSVDTTPAANTHIRFFVSSGVLYEVSRSY